MKPRMNPLDETMCIFFRDEFDKRVEKMAGKARDNLLKHESEIRAEIAEIIISEELIPGKVRRLNELWISYLGIDLAGTGKK